jgi:hypothetical protein
MIRTLITIAFASFILAVACLAGAAALGGRDIAENGWTVPSDWVFRIQDDPGGEGGTRIRRVAASERITRDLPWTGGDSLTLELPADVTYVQSTESRITLSGPKDVVERVVVDGGRIAFSEASEGSDITIDLNGVRMVDDADRLRITVSGPKVTRFAVNGSGDLDIRDYDQPAMDIQVQGSGDVKAGGRSDSLTLAIIGSGSIDASDLAARDAQVSTSGSGDATIAARGAVKVSVAGSGGVSLRAKPSSLTSEISGSGDVDQDY